MPEDFTSLLEALSDEGRSLVRPVPAGVIEAGGRARRRRRRQLAAATSGLAACAVAAGVAVGLGGPGSGSSPAPGVPGPVTSSPPPRTSSASQITMDTSHFLQNDEAPNPGTFQWKMDVAFTGPVMGVEFGICASQEPDRPPKLQAATEDVAQYRTPNGGGNAFESIFHYPTAAAAQQDYARLRPGAGQCPGNLTGHMTGAVTNGFSWVQSWPASNGGRPVAAHALVVRSGDSIAYWRYQDGAQGGVYDLADDQSALQRMADRLSGKTPVPATNTAPPADALPDSAWLDVSQIPFASADKSHGWYQMGSTPPEPGGDPATDLCASADGDIVDGTDAKFADHMFHGTPPDAPVYPGSNYLYSSGNQTIGTFPTADRASAAFAYAKRVKDKHGCTFKDSTSGDTVTRVIKAGAVTATGFSIQIDDTPGPSHKHVYFVVKGSHVSRLMVDFEQGDNSTAGDAAVLEAMAARLP